MEEENIDEAVGLILETAPESNPRPVDEAGVRGILEDPMLAGVPSSYQRGALRS